MTKKKVLENLFQTHIKGTPKEAIVKNKTVLLCHLTNAVLQACNFPSPKVYVKSRVLKHLYDSKPAEEFHFVISHLHTVIKYVDKIYQNKSSKRGELCFTKYMKGVTYFAPIEYVEESSKEEDEPEGVYVVTSFKVRKKSYLDSYKLVWSWKGGAPSS